MNGDKGISDQIVNAKIRRALLSGPDSITGDARSCRGLTASRVMPQLRKWMLKAI